MPTFNISFSLHGNITIEDALDKDDAIKKAGNIDLGGYVTGTSIDSIEEE